MIRMNDVPENVKVAMRQYHTPSETPDVFPAIFRIDNNDYYFFTFAPAAEQLIVEKNGTVPSFETIKKVALIATDFNHSIETTVHKGMKWIDPSFEKNYLKLEGILKEIESKLGPLSASIQNDLKSVQVAVGDMLAEQRRLVELVKKSLYVLERIQKSELATVEDQVEAREYRHGMANAMYRQNSRQLETEEERNRVIHFVNSKKSILNPSTLLLATKLKPYEKNMMNHQTHHEEMKELGELLSRGNVPLEEEVHAREILNKFRNPRN